MLTSVPLTEAEKAAIAILSPAKVLTQGQAKGEVELPIRYSEDALRQCANENEEWGRDWRLVYLRGNSLRQERERVGTSSWRNPKPHPCFYDNNKWWMTAVDDYWATERFESGYYLIDFNGRFRLISWRDQERAIHELGPDFIRAHEAMVSEAALRVFEVTRSWLLFGWYHWGRSLSSRRFRVSIGFFAGLSSLDSSGWFVNCAASRVRSPDIRVCLLRKF